MGDRPKAPGAGDQSLGRARRVGEGVRSPTPIVVTDGARRDVLRMGPQAHGAAPFACATFTA